jgi:DNA anti-recombination protein RmuC
VNTKYNKKLHNRGSVFRCGHQFTDGKKMIVDSKCLLTAYEKYINGEDDDLKNGYLKEHVNTSIKRHVRTDKIIRIYTR